MGKNLILVINPGSTSTKLALFEDDIQIEVESLRHSEKEISNFESVFGQKDMRLNAVLKWLEGKTIPNKLNAVVARGGLLRPMPSGTYKVTDKMIKDLSNGYGGEHASNLGGIIAKEISDKLNIPAFIVDPVAVDEMEEVARISGTSLIERKSQVHALNIRAVSRKVCYKINKNMDETSFVVAHLGGGISIVPLKNGKIIDCNNANEAGPFSPERAGGVPSFELVKLCYSNKYSFDEMKKILVGKGGLVSYLGTNDGLKVLEMINNGDKKAELILKAMGYQIAKEIGSMATVLKGNVDRIILTGGLAFNKILVSYISEMVNFIAPLEIVPGENEMLALAEGALRILRREEVAKIYEKEVQI